MRSRAALLIALAGMVTSGVAVADALKPFQVSYSWTWHGMTVAVSTLKLEQRQDNTWVYSSKSDPRGLGRMFSERPIQQSTLQVTDAGVRPLAYKADDGTSSTKRDADVQFDWDHNRATGVYESAKVDMALQPGVQDDLSVQIALMVELLAGRAPDRFLMIDKSSVREYRYSLEREESLDTPLGKLDTVVFKSQKSGSPRVTRFWCAPARGYIPVRVEQTKGDDVQWTMQLLSLHRD
jgi:hypothetical protein